MELINWQNKIEGDFIFSLKQITEKTFDITAHKWALVIANADKGVKKNQLRNFYDKVLELEEKAINTDENEFKRKVLPFVKMLKSKVAYAKNKQTSPVNKAFELFMNNAIDQIMNKEEFLNFKYLLEAIIGFYQEEEIIKPRGQVDCERSKFFIKQNKDKNCGGKKW